MFYSSRRALGGARVTRTIVILVGASLVLAAGCKPPTAAGGSIYDQSDPVLETTEPFKDFGDYILHFNAQPTTRLTPEIAMEYGITRSANRAMLTVSVLKKEEGTTGVPVRADVSALASNLTGQMKNLDSKIITEEDAFYFIAETMVANAETIVYTITATPEGYSDPLTVRYKHQFFID
jgi:hypothetical protein